MLSTEKAFDILPYVSDIYEKINIQEFIKTYKSKGKGKNKEENQILSGLDLFSFIFKQSGEVKEEFFEIVAIVEEKDIEEIKKQSFTQTIKTIKEIFTDKELVDFFKGAME